VFAKTTLPLNFSASECRDNLNDLKCIFPFYFEGKYYDR
jgi:hypothetical protein